MAPPPLQPIDDVALDALLAHPSPIGDALAGRRLTVAQALRVGDSRHRGEPVVIGRIERPAGAMAAFFDPLAPGAPPEIVLRRVDEHGDEKFALRTRIGYWDDEVGTVIVPADLETYRSDLTSVPVFFTWLVPQTGPHLPAALVHDGLVLDADRTKTYLGPDVDRVSADRIFRDGMRALGTSLIRRWLVWTAVAIATAWSHPTRLRRWWWRLVIVVSTAVIVGLGALATVDVVDCRDVLPWMGDRPLWQELLFGAGMAIAVPIALALLLWWGQRRAGVIAGIALAFVLHVTLALVVLLSLYTLAENVGDANRKQIILSVLGLVLTGAVPVAFLWWACR